MSIGKFPDRPSPAVAVVAVLTFLVFPNCSAPGDRDAGEVPSILLIDLGTVRADHLGCYGYARRTSPNIDRLATEAVRFEWAFSQAPNTAPSLASMLTGLYPATHGVQTAGSRLPSKAVTLAEALSERGYTTAAFVDGGYLSEGFGFDQGFSRYEVGRGGGLAEIGPRVIEWLRESAAEPFFLMIHSYDAHAPYDPPEDFRNAFVERLDSPAEDFEASTQRVEDAASGKRPFTPRELEHAEALYDAGILFVDHWIGKLMDELRDLGLDERTVVVLVADHGEAFLEHGELLHDTPYTPVTCVPLLVRLAGGEQAGTVRQVVETLDLTPTLLELAATPLPPGVQGESLVPLMRGEGKPPYLAFGEASFGGGRRYVAMGGYHLIVHADTGRKELFAFEADPLEQDDVAATEPRRVEALLQRLQEWEQKVDASVLGQEEAPMDEKTLEQLRSLGYVQ